MINIKNALRGIAVELGYAAVLMILIAVIEVIFAG